MRYDSLLPWPIHGIAARLGGGHTGTGHVHGTRFS
jgi:hypothetical protein